MKINTDMISKIIAIGVSFGLVLFLGMFTGCVSNTSENENTEEQQQNTENTDAITDENIGIEAADSETEENSDEPVGADMSRIGTIDNTEEPGAPESLVITSPDMFESEDPTGYNDYSLTIPESADVELTFLPLGFMEIADIDGFSSLWGYEKDGTRTAVAIENQSDLTVLDQDGNPIDLANVEFGTRIKCHVNTYQDTDRIDIIAIADNPQICYLPGLREGTDFVRVINELFATQEPDPEPGI